MILIHIFLIAYLEQYLIGHIDEIKWDNRPENLKPVSKRERAANFGKWAEPIPPGRRCMRCGSSKTGINEDGRDHWHKKPGGHICSSCYYKEWRKKHTNPIELSMKSITRSVFYRGVKSIL